MRFRNGLVAALVLGVAGLAQAQQLSPRETITASIDGKKVSINYGRPSLKGRTIDQLLQNLPPDRMWRTGVDQVTTLTTETDLVVGGEKVPAGKYTLYVHCAADGNWSLAVNSDQGVPLKKIFAAAPANLADEPWPHLQNYDTAIRAQEVVRAPLQRAAAAAPAELFTMTLKPAEGGAVLAMSWDKQTWSVDVKGAKR